jgi:hypothetical protein
MTYRPDPELVDQCHACGAPIAFDAAFCSACGVTHVAGRRPHRGRQWWIPAGIAAGALAAVIGGALVGVALMNRPQAGDALTASPSPSAPAGSEAAGSSSPSEPPATSSPSTPVAGILPNRAIAEVVTDGLNLRSAGNESASLLATLERGRRLFIIGDPSTSAGLRWYRVGTVDEPGVCEEGCGLIGFVATPIAVADTWIEEVELSCPSSPLTAEAMFALQPLEALHCYGRSEIVITGTMDHPIEGPITPYVYTPDWLTNQVTTFVRGAWWIWFRPHPDAALNPPQRGDVVRVTGHFEDPAATSCRGTVDPDFFGGEIPDDFESTLDPARLILDCRATFVWTGYEVIGFEDLGPCCGSLPVDLGTSWLPRHAPWVS